MQDNEPLFPWVVVLPPTPPAKINPYWREFHKHSSYTAAAILLYVVTHYKYTAARGKLAECEGECGASAWQL